MIDQITRSGIRGYLEASISISIEKYRPERRWGTYSPRLNFTRVSTKPIVRPFYSLTFPKELTRISKLERLLSEALDASFDGVARLIARKHHPEAQADHEVWGYVGSAALKEIENQVTKYANADLARDALKPSLEEMIQRVLSVRDKGTMQWLSTRSDLYIRTQDETEYYFYVGSPTPGKNQCLSMIRRILRIHLLRGLPRPQVHAYFAMAYNPYGPTRADYRWSVAQMYFPLEEATLIGREFWNIVGGETAYEELLDIYAEVGRDKRKYIIDSLGLGL